jgi:hypothetical protein
VTRPSALKSGIATGASTVVVALAAALAAVILLQKFGRSAESDGLLAAYNVYLVLAIVASTGRFVFLPALTRAQGRGELGRELRTHVVALTLVMAPLIALAAIFADRIAPALVAGSGAQHLAAQALPWFVAAGYLQILAAIAASGLAALDDYLKAAFAYGAGAIVNLLVFVALMSSQGVIALAWGSCANGAVAVLPLALVLARRGFVRLGRAGEVGSRLVELGRGSALLLSLQLLYVISYRAASGIGTGEATSFAVAYLLAGGLVTATASSISLISSAPLTRRGVDATAAARHIVETAWLSLSIVAGGAAVAAVAGEPLFSRLFGGTFSGDVGGELGLLLVYMAPWMVASVAFMLTFPLLFVLERPRVLIPLAIAAPLVEVGAVFLLRDLFGIAGVAVALAVTTLAVVLVLVAALSRAALAVVGKGLTQAAVVLGLVALVAFVPFALFLPRPLAAALGLSLYALVLLALRPPGLRTAWVYVRALHD